MKHLAIMVFLAGVFSLQSTDQLCVVHLEAPKYPRLAHVARIQGETSITIEIDANGEVATAKATTGHPLLRQAAADNIRNWTFQRPAKAPVTQTVVYEYGIEGKAVDYACPTVTFDLPTRVRIVIQPLIPQP